MNGWIIMAVLTASCAVIIWRKSRMAKGGMQLVAAALFLALAGYSLQGHPGTAGSYVRAKSTRASGDTGLRRFMTSQQGKDAEIMGYAEAWERAGHPELAVRTIKIGLKDNPNSPDLWVGLGAALTSASDGFVSPAARFAFDRAATLSPNNPGTAFFKGLAYAQDQKIPEAAQAWLSLLDRTPPEAPWRADVEGRLAAIAAMIRQ